MKTIRTVVAVLGLCALLVTGVALAADYLSSGGDNQSNTMSGNVDYSRGSCWDGTYWDRIKCSTVNGLGAKLDDDAAGNCVAITAGSVQFTLPTAGDWYCVSAIGNSAYILCGTNPTATTTVTTGFSFFVPEGASRCRILTGAKCAVIGPSAAGSLCFEHMNSAL